MHAQVGIIGLLFRLETSCVSELIVSDHEEAIVRN